MIKKFTPLIAFIIILLAILWSQFGLMPSGTESDDIPETNFSIERAYAHVEKIAEEPHYLGSRNHSLVRNYIVQQLQQMGLFVQTQEGFSINKYGIAARPQNIISKIEGSEADSGKALLLLTHYDSAMHSSYGASDAASGVATILEGIRAFLASETVHKNNIIIVFTDAEELGLNGAELFVRDHEWSEEVGVALNFESRGSGGSSFMLLETNAGNAELIDNFIQAGSNYPVTNSLAYSIYKMLPNDTDLTVLREQGNINGFNFAFIDDHFDYHTATDIPENLDLNTLAHQGSYLMPLLSYFSNADLTDLNSSEDVIYFNFPLVKMISYPFSWIFPLLILAAVLFVAVVFYGFRKKRLTAKKIFIGFAPLLLSMVVSGILVYLLWQACLLLYPQYLEMEHGFTYNGYKYIAVAIFIALAVNFFAYRKFTKKENNVALFVAPLFLWLLLSTVTAFFLKGASYFVIPLFFGILQLFIFLKQKKPNVLLLSLLCLPAIFIIMPFVPNFPVALGLKLLFSAAIMTVLLFVLLLPVFLFLKKFKIFGMLFWIVAFLFFIIAHFQADFNEDRPKPNSLVYILDADTNTASWNTYDYLLDPWTENYFGENPSAAEMETAFGSKYNSGLKYSTSAPLRNVPKPDVFIKKIDTATTETVYYHLKIAPQRPINRMDFFADKNFNFQKIKVNGMEPDSFEYNNKEHHIFKNRFTENLMTYYASNMDTLRLEIEVNAGETPKIILYETSNDLMENPLFSVPARTEAMIPKPFIINDAVIVKKRIKLE